MLINMLFFFFFFFFVEKPTYKSWIEVIVFFFPFTKPNLRVEKVEIQFQCHFGPLDLKKICQFFLHNFS